MNIEFTTQEARFLYENLSKMQIPVTHPNAAVIATLAAAVLQKLKAAIETEMPKLPASAATRNGHPSVDAVPSL